MVMAGGPKPYWRIWDRWNMATLSERRLVNAEDAALYRIADTLDEAVAENHRLLPLFTTPHRR